MRSLFLLATRPLFGKSPPFRAHIYNSGQISLSVQESSILSSSSKMPKSKGDKPRFVLKTPKGTKDWEGKDVVIRDKLFAAITDVFRRHGAVNLDTPVFELREILAGKYGEDSKLIYDLADQGGEICSLRYDLTVPFARYLAMNPQIQNIKRYHLAKVYRRDQPAVAKGRMREFYQCDFDIAGSCDSMLSDAEVIRVTKEVFEDLGWKGEYTIKINHRKILDGIFQVCGVPEDKTRSISSAVDKLDKAPWDEVYREMTDEKGLDKSVADRIGAYVQRKGGSDLLTSLASDEKLNENTLAKEGLDEMKLLFSYLETFDASNCISLDMSLARGLDYYTGVIFEVVTEGSAPPSADGKPIQGTTKKDKQGKSTNKLEADEDRSADPTLGVGSIAAGGRYDDLVGMFSGKGRIPCVGISFGVDRIFSITKSRMEKKKGNAMLRSNEIDVFIMAFGGKGFNGLLKERMEVASTLWNAGVKAEFLYKVKPKLPAQFKAAESNNVPFAIILGEDELAQGMMKIKQLGLPDGHPEKEGVMVRRNDLVAEVKNRLRGFESKERESQIESDMSSGLQKMKVQDRDDVPDEAPVIPTVT